MALRYFLACLVLPSCLVSGELLKYSLLGQKVHLKPDIPGHPDEILWKHQDSTVVTFNGKEEHVYSLYQNRVTLDWVSAELYITDLRREDSGVYELETLVNKKWHRFQYELEVIGKVTKPSVSCDMNSSSSDTRGARATLTCSAEPTQPQSLMKYEWESSANMLPGPELTILLEDEHDDKIYTCRVSNPLTFETTTFNAKTCYPDKSSSVALTVSLIILFIILLLIAVVGVMFCKLKNKACFAKSNRDDVENRIKPGATEERDQDDESKPLFDRAPTLPSHQQLRPLAQGDYNTAPDLPANNHREHADLDKGHVESVLQSKKEEDETEEANSSTNGISPTTPLARLSMTQNSPVSGSKKSTDEETVSPPVSLPLGRKPSFSEDQHNPSSNHKDDADGDQVPGPSDQVLECDPSDSDEENVASPVGVLDFESEKEEDEIEEEKSPAANVPPPPTQPLTQNSPDKGMEDTSGEYKDETNSDQVHGETESHSPEKSTEADESTEEEQPPTAPEQNMSETASHEQDSKLSQEETHKKEDDHPEMEKSVSGDERESDGEQAEDNLYLDTSQSPTPKHSDNTQTNTFENAALQDPDQQVEGKSGDESDECEGQLDSSTAEEDYCERKSDEKSKDECDPKEEKPDNKNESEDKEGQQKTEAVEKSK
ncbi:dentin matrix acidic phosphoprotein 1-like isoform X3 [Paralichthys olivaceus]|uniref:dentin matrix acidic phosphoprotein 1-like isoform X3 n=1 Tax=Paralichthys olivaceus TaxID=8255 RepID=UPI003752F86F